LDNSEHWEVKGPCTEKQPSTCQAKLKKAIIAMYEYRFTVLSLADPNMAVDLLTHCLQMFHRLRLQSSFA